MHDSLYFSDHHLQVREMVRDFAKTVVKPTAHQYDLESRFPWDHVKQMAELGLFGIPWPEGWGGSGMAYPSYITVMHELAKVDASHAITVSAHTTLGTSPSMDFGSAEQKRRFVPLLATGTVLGGFGLTEPGAGSDAGGTKTTAVDRGDHYVLNGSKIFITHAGVGEIFCITARTDPNAKRTHGITAFVVTKDTCDLEETKRVGIGHANSSDLPKCRGVLSGKKEDKLGWRASDTRELIFQDAIVPKENVLGPVNNGFRQFLHTLDGGRIGIAALALGLAEGALEECVTYTSTRKQFGRPVASFQGVHFALADMATEVEAAKQLVYHAAWLKQQGLFFKAEDGMRDVAVTGVQTCALPIFVGDSAAVHPDPPERRLGIGGHRLQHIAALERDRFERRACEMSARGAAREADDGAARVLIQIGRASCRERV